MTAEPSAVTWDYRRSARRSTPWLTAAVTGGTLLVSTAALASPALMRLMTRDLTKMRTGQWWRVLTPLFVQPDGWGQLMFNVLGIVVVGVAVERRMGRTGWAVTFVLGGLSGIAIMSVLQPGDRGGGSSDAVAALIGALAVLVASDPPPHPNWGSWPAQLYSVCFASYLTALDFGGVGWSIVAGNASIVAFAIAARGLRPSRLARAGLVIILSGGVLMTFQQDGHGTGIIMGMTTALLLLAFRRIRTNRARHLAR